VFGITFDYSNLKVHGFETEEGFLKEKMGNRQHVEGKAEKFKEKWFKDRENKYEPRFIAYFNKRFAKSEIKIERNKGAKYTMNIETVWIYPGYNVVAVSEPAKITAKITVRETENPNAVLLVVQYDKSIGLEQGQFDIDQGDRIALAYEKLAKNITMQLKRFL
jgi:hypothetical protein